MRTRGKNIVYRLIILILCTAVLAYPVFAEEPESDTVTFTNVNEAIAYVKKEQPHSLDLGAVSFSLNELLSIKQAMPENAKLSFCTTIGSTVISDSDTAVDLNGLHDKLTADDLEHLITLVPGVRKIDVVKHRELGNKVMVPLADKYPDIDFVWLIVLSARHSLSSGATAYSTMNGTFEKDNRLSSSQLKPIKYAKHLRALDLGHNRLDDISFVADLPELRILILADNRIKDISPLSACTHLQYVELFTNQLKDISALGNCTELLDLNITTNKITDLKALDGCGKLERLWASHNPLSDEGKQHFIDAHPGCNAMFNNEHATSDGWRKHWRYDQYVSMFKNHVWKEFEPPAD